jgi:hypothetical protein
MIASIIGAFFGLIFFAISLAGFAFWLWMLIHAISNKGLSDGEKIVWVLVIIFLPLLGSIIYFFVGKSKGSSSI